MFYDGEMGAFRGFCKGGRNLNLEIGHFMKIWFRMKFL